MRLFSRALLRLILRFAICDLLLRICCVLCVVAYLLCLVCSCVFVVCAVCGCAVVRAPSRASASRRRKRPLPATCLARWGALQQAQTPNSALQPQTPNPNPQTPNSKPQPPTLFRAFILPTWPARAQTTAQQRRRRRKVGSGALCGGLLV